MGLEDEDEGKEQRKDREGDKGQPPVQKEHEPSHHKYSQDIAQGVHQAVGEKIQQRIDVVDDADHDFAGRAVIKEIEAQVLDVVEKILPQRCQGFASGDIHQQHLKANCQRRDGRKGNHRQGVPLQHGIPPLVYCVDRVAHQQGRGQTGGGGDEHPQDRNNHAFLIGGQIPEQTAQIGGVNRRLQHLVVRHFHPLDSRHFPSPSLRPGWIDSLGIGP